MRFDVKGVLGCKDAAFNLRGNTCLVVGPNSAGKSSVRYAMSAVLAQRDNPLELPKSRTGLYKNEYTADTRATLEDGEGNRVDWEPAKGLAVSGDPAASHPGAVGLEDPLEYTKKEWRHLFDQQVPDKDLFAKALRVDLGRKDTDDFRALADRIYDRVISDGVDATLANYREQARKSKRDWEQAVATSGASETYGKQKASNWTPIGWDPEMESITKEQLDESLALRRQARDVAMRSVGYDEAVKDSLAKKIEKRPALEQAIEDAEKKAEQYKEKAEEGDAKVAKKKANMRAEEQEIAKEANVIANHAGTCERQACPYCGGALVIAESVDREIVAFTAEEYEESVNRKQATNARIQAAHEEGMKKVHNAQGIVSELRRKEREKRDQVVAAKAELAQCDKAEEDLAKLSETNPVTEEERQRADTAVRKAEENREIWLSWAQAQKAHKAVQGFSSVVESLEKGQLSRELVKGLDGVSKVVAALGKKFGMKITLEDYIVTVNDRPVKVCAENERWLARFACQVGIAMLTDSPAVLADGAELLFNDRHSNFIELMENWPDDKPKVIAFATWESDAEACGEIPRVHIKEGAAEED